MNTDRIYQWYSSLTTWIRHKTMKWVSVSGFSLDIYQVHWSSCDYGNERGHCEVIIGVHSVTNSGQMCEVLVESILIRIWRPEGKCGLYELTILWLVRKYLHPLRLCNNTSCHLTLEFDTQTCLWNIALCFSRMRHSRLQNVICRRYLIWIASLIYWRNRICYWTNWMLIARTPSLCKN